MSAVHTRTKRALAALVLSCVFLLPVIGLAKADPKQEEITYRYLETFANVLSILQDNYVEEIETKREELRVSQ